jgi:nucleotide-binding universal stress UspA family protein
MTLLNAILVTTDFSDDAHNAVRRAALIAAQHNARMTLLHVVDPTTLKGPRAWFSSPSGIDHKVAVAQAALGRLAAEVAGRHDVHVSVEALVGHPLELVCRKAEEVDLLVIGSRRANSLRSLIFGTPTEQMLRLVRRPVLVTRQAAQTAYRRVLIAVDLDKSPHSMLRSASALAPAASLYVFHALSTRRMDRLQASDVPSAVIRDVGASERQRGLARLHAVLASTGLAGAQASVDHGEAPRLTLARQQELGADLIVLGKDGSSALCNFLLGSVPQRVLSSAACDVLVLPKVALRGESGMAPLETWLDAGPRRTFEGVEVSQNIGVAGLASKRPVPDLAQASNAVCALVDKRVDAAGGRVAQRSDREDLALQ